VLDLDPTVYYKVETLEMRQRGRPITLSEEDLLDAALEVFLQRGLDATTADVAKQAKISEGAIFHRYKTKEALLLAVLERQLLSTPEFEELASVAGKGDIADHLFRLAMALVEKTRTLFPLLMLAFSSPIKMSELMGRGHPARVRLVRILARYFEAEARLGRLQRIDSEILARTFWGSVHEYVMAELFEGGPLLLPEASYLRGIIHVLLEGVKAKDPAGVVAAERRRRT
jgi:AcrR family transcriptional regulator